MTGYTTRVAALRAAADATRSASEQIAQVRLSEAVADAGAAMPGSRSATAFATLAAAWDDELAAWREQASRYADDVDAAADVYRANDAVAGRGFGGDE